MNWLSLITGFFYIVLGIVIIVYKFFFVTLDPPMAYILGAIMVAYGVFRIFRAIAKIKASRDED